MIGRLKGTVAAIETETMILDVLGVGYEVHATPRMLARHSIGDNATLSIETLVREDLIRLYGFDNREEREAFRLLQSVQGVGAKHALAILQTLPPTDLFDAIAAEDITAISRAHGVGKKIAQRIATELQSKAGIMNSGSDMSFGARRENTAQSDDQTLSARADAVSALSNLGYDGVEARRAVSRAAEEMDSPGVEALIKAALKQLSVA